MSSIGILIVLFVVAFAAAFPAPRDEIFFRDDDDDDDTGVNVLKIEDDNELLPSTQAKSIGSESESVDPQLMNGEYFQGDIKLNDGQMKAVLSNNSVPSRTGIIDEFYRWPKSERGFVLVPYYLHKESDFSELWFGKSFLQLGLKFDILATNQIELIRSAMADIHHYSCIRFVPWTTEKDFVLIHAGKGCSSNLGKVGGQQDISLSKKGCFLRGIIMHELIHGRTWHVSVDILLIFRFSALGYDHMHNHAERDKHIQIKWDNIVLRQRHNFEKVNPRLFSNFGTEYDVHSIMVNPPFSDDTGWRLKFDLLALRQDSILKERTGHDGAERPPLQRDYWSTPLSESRRCCQNKYNVQMRRIKAFSPVFS